jgi:signal transduction histidine kinase
VFEKFFRVDEHSGQIPGLGIGLYISREIVERHGGSIGAQSSVGEGSQFFFTLPLSNATFA